jgi:dienelactone hydrolase
MGAGPLGAEGTALGLAPRLLALTADLPPVPFSSGRAALAAERDPAEKEGGWTLPTCLESVYPDRRKRMARRLIAAACLLAAWSLVNPRPARSAAAPTPAQDRPAAAALVPAARAMLQALSDGDYVRAAKDFDETMLKVFGPEKLAAFWKQFQSQVGAFKSQTEARSEKLSGYDIIFIACEFEKAKLNARVVFDAKGKIAGLQFVPYYPPANYEPPPYADPKVFEELEVTVGSGEWKLPGTLTLPKGPGPFPGLVLVHGSGPNDRNEALGPNRPFQDLAWGLATRGIAVLRYDKRTKVYAERYKSDPKLRASLTVWQETIDDALEAARTLSRNPKVAPRDVFILGHSLGGMLIPRIALAGRDLDLAGFIILAGLTRPVEDTIVQQMTYLAGLNGPPGEEAEKQLEKYRAEAAEIKALKPSDAGSMKLYFNAAAAYWLDLRSYDPPEVAREVKRPMLILQGGRDYQVTTADFDNWKRALEGRPSVTFKFYPGANHLFFEGRGIITPNEYQYVHGSVAEPVVREIADWIKQVSAEHR